MWVCVAPVFMPKPKRSIQTIKKEIMKQYQKKQKKTKALHKKKGQKRPSDRKPQSVASREKRKKAPLREGIFCGTRQGYGFIHAEGLREDAFVPAHAVCGALHGDRVAFTLVHERDGKISAEVREIRDVGRETVCGILAEERILRRGRRTDARRVRRFVVPDDTRFGQEIEVEAGTATAGDKVEVRLLRAPHGPCTGVVVRSFGRAGTKSASYRSVLAENGIRTVFPPEVIEEAETAAREPLSGKGRTRPHELILTIDGADAKDLDDAISLTRTEEGNYRLGVHIADVSHYVKEGGAVESEALARGTSVYFTDKVVPMLPEALSNGACSLNAGEDKYAISAYMTIDKKGAILETRLYSSMIRSSVRGVYSEVNDLLINGDASPFYEKYAAAYPTLRELHGLYTVLKKKAEARGMIDFETPEARILLDENGDPTEVVRRTRGDAEKMIEQFMLAANEGVATLLHKLKLPCVYRVHEDPDPEKIADLVTFAHSLGLKTEGITEASAPPKALQGLLLAAREKGLETPVSYVMLRSMQKANYKADKSGHYGLGIRLYCHFTSPIRRLSDLMTHRIIRALVFGESEERFAKSEQKDTQKEKGVAAAALTHYKKLAVRAADMATEGELRALRAERGIDALYKAIYMSRYVGEIFPAVITGMTSFGIFAELPNTCEGMIALAETDDRFLYDEARHLLVGSHTTYRLGDSVEVEVLDVDLVQSKIYLRLLAKS